MGQGTSKIWKCWTSDTRANNTPERNDSTQRRNQFDITQRNLENLEQQQSDTSNSPTEHLPRKSLTELTVEDLTKTFERNGISIDKVAKNKMPSNDQIASSSSSQNGSQYTQTDVSTFTIRPDTIDLNVLPPEYQTHEIVPPPEYRTHEIVPPPEYRTREIAITTIENNTSRIFSGEIQPIDTNLEYPTELNNRGKSPNEYTYFTKNLHKDTITSAFNNFDIHKTRVITPKIGKPRERRLFDLEPPDALYLFQSYKYCGTLEYNDSTNDDNVKKVKRKLNDLDMKRTGVTLGKQISGDTIDYNKVKMYENHLHDYIHAYMKYAKESNTGEQNIEEVHKAVLKYIHIGSKNQEEYTDKDIRSLVILDLAQLQRNKGRNSGHDTQQYNKFQKEYNNLVNLITPKNLLRE